MSDVQFFGESFALKAPEDYEYAMCKFADVMVGGVDDGGVDALAAVMRFCRAVIADKDWQRFDRLAEKNKAQVKRDLMPIAVAAFRQEVPDHPTEQPSISSGGQTSTDPRSGSEPAPQGSPTLTLVRELEAQGRADKAEFVLMAERARASA